MRSEGDLEEERHEVVAPDFLTGIKAELEELREILTPPDDDGEG
jgi:hypothetical protein